MRNFRKIHITLAPDVYDFIHPHPSDSPFFSFKIAILKQLLIDPVTISISRDFKKSVQKLPLSNLGKREQLEQLADSRKLLRGSKRNAVGCPVQVERPAT